MTVEITGVEIGAEKIIIEAVNLETILMAEDLFEDMEATPIIFEFDRTARNGAEMKYLYRVVQGQRKCKAKKSMGAKLEALVGVITQISESFKIQQA